MSRKKVVVAGGGAAGLTAAIMAARKGAEVTVLEQNEKPGKKICATGNGKCNLSNTKLPKDAYRGSHPQFVQGALSQFSQQDTRSFFEKMGIYFTDRDGCLYPRSGQAQSVVDVLVLEARSLGVKIKTNEKVTGIRREECWKVYTEGWHYPAEAVILANGSKASAISGSDGSGYLLAEALGHHVIKPLPALTALKCQGKGFSAWAGVRTEGEVTLCIDGKPLYRERGELQLTEYGISGIPVFQISRYAVRALDEKKAVSLNVDFLPEIAVESFPGFLEERRKSCPYKSEKELLLGIFPDKLIKVLTGQKNLTEAVKAFPLKVTGGMSFAQAQVCSGGVDTAEVDCMTMESVLNKGIYFAGELLDIDGMCGGYNLQWAWSSGACAGSHAAEILS
ncbi:NAD(P)/FAD-dependent oxidoreductase [Ruminococcus sp. 5_1_39BFAA]|uniref:NAD(P)/FAD-dependent oxidoreductase n=1 Tax=Ruminococcus sp. 5_1_39BFAA TaxID=457412 RepID=UPI003567405C